MGEERAVLRTAGSPTFPGEAIHWPVIMDRTNQNPAPIPIPPEGRINHWDSKVSIYRTEFGKRRRTVIGKAVSDTMMVPNANFQLLFPERWMEHYGFEDVPRYRIHVGLYAVMLSIGWKTRLYPVLTETLGIEHAHALMDYAMFRLRKPEEELPSFAEDMFWQLCFSKKLLSGAWYEHFFEHELTDERIDAFRTAWLSACARNGVQSVWIRMDGGNCLWAVDARTGRPVTWSAGTPGDVVRLIETFGIRTEGVMLGEHGAVQEAFDRLEAGHMRFAAFLKPGTPGFSEMMRRHAEDVRWRVERLVEPARLTSPVLFGLTDHVKAFASSPKTTCTGLLFSPNFDIPKAMELVTRVREAEKDLRRRIAEDPESAAVPSGLEAYLEIVFDHGRPVDVLCDMERLQKTFDCAGFCALASSDERPVEELAAVFRLRDVSGNPFGGPADETRTRLALAFMTAVVETELRRAFRELELEGDMGEMLEDDVNWACLTRMPAGVYEASLDCSPECEALFDYFGFTKAHFAQLAKEISWPASPEPKKIPVPGVLRPSLPRGRPKKKAEPAGEPATKRKPGRPKGSRNKATLARLAAEAAEEPRPKRKPGRPKGSKNKKTLEREALAARDGQEEDA